MALFVAQILIHTVLLATSPTTFSPLWLHPPIGLDSTWHAQIEDGAYFKLSKFDSVKIICFVNDFSIL